MINKHKQRTVPVLADMLAELALCTREGEKVTDMGMVRKSIRWMGSLFLLMGFVTSPVLAEVDLETTQSAETLEETSQIEMSQTKTPAAPQIDPKEIQKALAEAGFYKGTIDGVIGKKSRAAIRAFQEKHGLKADGVCGPKTWEKLKAYLEEAQEMDAVDQELATPTADEGNSLTEDAAMDPWTEPEPEPESSELKQKLVS